MTEETVEMRIVADGNVTTEQVGADVPKWTDDRVLDLAVELNNKVNKEDYTVERTNEAVLVRPKAQYG